MAAVCGYIVGVALGEKGIPKEWLAQVSIRSRKSERFKKPDKRSFRDLLEEAFL